MSAPAVERIDALALRRTLSAFPTGITVLGAVVDGRPVGLAANSFTSVSLSPPIVSVAIAHLSSTGPLLASLPALGISILGAAQGGLVEQLRRPATQRFDGIAWHEGPSGELLVNGSAAQLRVTPFDVVGVGDHDVHFLGVVGLDHDAGVEPLVFHGSALRRLG